MGYAKFTLLMNNSNLESMYRTTFLCLLQTGRNTDSESGGSRTILHGSQLTGGKKVTRRCKKIESGSVPAKTFFFTSRTGLHTVSIPLICGTQNILTEVQ